MASLKLSSLPIDTFDSNKFTFSSIKPKTHSPFIWSTSPYIPVSTNSGTVNSSNKVSCFSSKTSEFLDENKADNNTVETHIKDFLDNDGAKKSSNFEIKMRSKKYPNEKIKFSRGFVSQNLFLNNGELDVDYSMVKAELSLDECNAVLRRLERSSDHNALKFFQWMESNGKLEKNVDAYSLVLRVLGRREDWDTAEELVRRMSSDSGCELNYRIFNTVIYACSKKGNVQLGNKWFLMMLEYNVRPNVATFGMVMGLYRKGWNVEQAEFAFSMMRKLGIRCLSCYSAMITIYTRLSLHDKAEEVIGLMKEDKVMLNLENWLVKLNAYCQQGKLDEAEAVLVGMNEAGFAPNLVAYNTMITGYGKISSMDSAQCLFEGLRNVGLEPDETTYRSMVEGWGRANNYGQAKWHFEELLRLGFKPNSSNLYTLINLQAKNGDEEGALATLDRMKEMGCQYSSILGTLLQAYKSAGRIDKVPLLLKGPLYRHILVNQNSCSILVINYVKHHLVDDAINVLQDKRWRDPPFESNLYHVLICTCKELGRLENAVKMYTSIPVCSDKPNLHIMSTMIDIYTAMDHFAEAENIYLKVKASEIQLDMIAYSVVVRMYVKAGSLKDACSVLEAMNKQKEIVPDVYLFCDMLRTYQQCGMLNKLVNVYHRILKSGITWDQELYNCVINCCARALTVDQLSKLFDEMLQRGLTPNSLTINVMLDVYGKSKHFQKARGLFQMARKQGLADTISYNTLIASYGKIKDFRNMLLYVREMQSDGFSVSLEAYNSMLDAYGKEGQIGNFRGVLRRMKRSGYSSDNYTYNIMINIYGEKGWIDDIAEVLTELKEGGLKPDLCSYNTLIKAYGIVGMVEDAVFLLKGMREKGIEPDKITYKNLITALERNDMFLEAVKWSLWVKQINMYSS